MLDNGMIFASDSRANAAVDNPALRGLSTACAAVQIASL